MKNRDPIRGAAVIVMIAVAFCFFRLAAPVLSPGATGERPPHSNGKSGDWVVALAGEAGHRGVYFIPRGSSLRDFLAVAGVDADRMPAAAVSKERLKNASVVTVRAAGPAGASSVTVGGMTGSMRYALGLPIDLNSASQADLEVVPGIGEKTALRIIDYRRGNGPFRTVSDLRNVKGIKEKKYDALRRYFCVE
ncbi:MAG TPA: ComEA family DNA-binding protein [Syntrophales bacterium]|jgi:competence protein ComEA|nr:ComEA family DNA-binding protein [Syntrophales bacterium]